MRKINDQVVNPELSKIIAELGFKAESRFYWPPLGADPTVSRLASDELAAFTVSELLEIMPPDIGVEKVCDGEYRCFMGISEDGETYWDRKFEEGDTSNYGVFNAETAADACALMLIHLIQKGLLV